MERIKQEMNLVFALKSVQKPNLVPYFEPPSSCMREWATPPLPSKNKMNGHVPNTWKKKIEKKGMRFLPLAPPLQEFKELIF